LLFENGISYDHLKYDSIVSKDDIDHNGTTDLLLNIPNYKMIIIRDQGNDKFKEHQLLFNESDYFAQNNDDLVSFDKLITNGDEKIMIFNSEKLDDNLEFIASDYGLRGTRELRILYSKLFEMNGDFIYKRSE